MAAITVLLVRLIPVVEVVGVGVSMPEVVEQEAQALLLLGIRDPL